MLAGAAIELPGMPRADDHVIVEGALGEGSALVGARAVDGMEFSGDIAKSHPKVAANDFEDGAVGHFGAYREGVGPLVAGLRRTFDPGGALVVATEGS